MVYSFSPTLYTDSGYSQSLWMDIAPPDFPPLTENMHADVCIVGSGIAGLSCAYTLAKQGKSVIVIDQAHIASGQSARTTAHLTYVLDDRYFYIEDLFGEEKARQVAMSHAAAIDYMESIVLAENIVCDFERVDGYLFAAPEDSLATLDKEYTSVHKLGMPIEKIEKGPFPSFDVGPCLKFPRQACIHILKYLHGLTKAITSNKGKIFAHTHVSHIEDGAPCVITTSLGLKVTATSVVMATCTPVNDRIVIHAKQCAYRSYVIATALPKGYIPQGLYWDTAEPYHYIRMQKHETNPELEWVLIGGEDHKTGQDLDIQAKYDHLEKWAKVRFPLIDTIPYRWSGQIFAPYDSIALIGKNPGDKNIYIATGDCGNGITYGTIAGMLLTALILGQEHPWQNLYDPTRKTFKAMPKLIKRTCNVAWQYADWLTPGEKETVEALPLGAGMIIREGLKKLAVYRDEENHVHFCSAFCPHLGGCVRWNSGEKSWDCPCHGSRFAGDGRVMNGPSIDPLCPVTQSLVSKNQ